MPDARFKKFTAASAKKKGRSRAARAPRILPRHRVLGGCLRRLRPDCGWDNLHHCLAHFFPRLELDDAPLGDGNVVFRLVGVAPDSCLAGFDFKYPEVAKLNSIACGQRIRNVVQGLLDDVQNLRLNHPGLLADADYEFAFSHTYWCLGCACNGTENDITTAMPRSQACFFTLKTLGLPGKFSWNSLIWA